jgi:uncharacterized Ntn-hydrolase superfamily protein
MINLRELTNTYSIVAYDPELQQLGAAMQTHNFEACNRVIHVDPTFGAIASQANTNPLYGFAGFDLLRLGLTPQQVIDTLGHTDDDFEKRQIGIVDLRGNAAAHTGRQCIDYAGHRIGRNYSCQANMMLRDKIWDAMGDAFESSGGDLADRLIRALEAAQALDGDIRGAQSAAVRVVSTRSALQPWDTTLFDFKVYDDPHPVEALKNLVGLKRTHNRVLNAFDLSEPPNICADIDVFYELLDSIPNQDSRQQYLFYFALSLQEKGYADEGTKLLDEVYRENPVWEEINRRLKAADLK